MPKIEIIHGDCLEELKKIKENTIDAIVTDPPSGIGFMGEEWDDFRNNPKTTKSQVVSWMRSGVKFSNKERENFISWLQKIAEECLRVLKPGGHALVWALPRTSHWTATAWENAGFQVRDKILYISSKSELFEQFLETLTEDQKKLFYVLIDESRAEHCFGQGFPKSLNIANQIGQWSGWGTALKPAIEDWWLFRKPIEKGLSIAENVLKYGTGGLNIDACRIGTEKTLAHHAPKGTFAGGEPRKSNTDYYENHGRFPANLIHDGSEEIKSLFPNTKGGKFRKGIARKRTGFMLGEKYSEANAPDNYGDSGSASRFFYVAKASRNERDMGLGGMEQKEIVRQGLVGEYKNPKYQNNHPTVKPIKLMEYLIRLITPLNGIVLDPFMGSGSTGIAAKKLGYNFIGIEKNLAYVEIAKKRIGEYN